MYLCIKFKGTKKTINNLTPGCGHRNTNSPKKMKNNNNFIGITFDVQAIDNNNGRNWLQKYYCTVPAWFRGLDGSHVVAWAQRALPELMGCGCVNVRSFEIAPAPDKKESTWTSWSKLERFCAISYCVAVSGFIFIAAAPALAVSMICGGMLAVTGCGVYWHNERRHDK